MSSHVLKRWEPENPGFWQETGSRVAYRNLWISIPALMLAFAIWMAAEPTPLPAPWTRTVSPGRSSARPTRRPRSARPAS